MRLVRAEFRKLFSTKLWLWMLITSLGLTALFVSLTIAFDGQDDGPGAFGLVTAEGQRNLFATAGFAGVLSLVLGTIGITGEFRHQTITPTFLTSPHRGRVVLAKLLTYAIVGLGLAAAGLALTLAISLPWVSAKDIDLSLTANGIPGTMLGVVVGTTVYGLVGVGIGALVRNQIAAVVGSLVFLFILEPVVSAIPKVRDYYKYFPGGANAALTDSTQNQVSLLDPWQGGALLVAYGLALAMLGSYLSVRRDVT